MLIAQEIAQPVYDVLYSEGVKAYVLSDYESAKEKFSNAMP
jgi:hypothetical protein